MSVFVSKIQKGQFEVIVSKKTHEDHFGKHIVAHGVLVRFHVERTGKVKDVTSGITEGWHGCVGRPYHIPSEKWEKDATLVALVNKCVEKAQKIL